MIVRILFFVLLISGNSLLALDATFSADSLHGTLGSIIQFQWDITHELGARLSTGELDLEGTGIELLDEQLEAGDQHSVLKFQTAVYDSVGIYHFPSLTLYSETSDTRDSLFLRGPDLEIQSVLTPADSTFRDIKDLHRIHQPLPVGLIALILGLLAALLAVIYLYRRYHKKDREQEDAGPILVPPEQAHVIALRALEQLKREKYLKFEQFKIFYSELSHILKQYLENRFLIQALELTTQELYDLLETMVEIPADIRNTVDKILQTADFVKFAKGSSTELEAGKLLTDAVSIVNQTKINLNQGDSA